MRGDRGLTPQQLEEAKTVVDDVRRGRSATFWSARKLGLWPHDAMGHTLLAHAILATGEALFPDWTGLEPAEFMLPPLDGSRSYVSAGFDEVFAVSLLSQHRPDLAANFSATPSLTAEEWLEAETVYAEHVAQRRAIAMSKMLLVHNRLSIALADGALVSAVRVNQQFLVLPAQWWIDEEANGWRFLESQTDPTNSTKTHPADVVEATLGDQRLLLCQGNAWVFVTKASLSAFVATLAKPRVAVRREERAFSEAALDRLFHEFINSNPGASRERWVKAAQAALNVSVPAARKVWKKNEPVSGRKPGPKQTRH